MNIPETVLIVSGTSFIFCQMHYRLAKVLAMPAKFQTEKDTVKKDVMYSEYVACFASLIHALGLLFAGIYVWFFGEERWAGKNETIENRALAFSIGYFLVDTYFGIVKKYNGTAMFIHHVVSILISLNAILTNRSGYLVMLSYSLGEISNPFMLTKLITQGHPQFKEITYFSTLIFGFVFVLFRGPIAAYFGEIAFSEDICIFLRITIGAACELIRVSFALLGVHGF